MKRESIIAGLGHEKAGLLLSSLIERYRGKHFEATEFHALADELELELVPLLGDWLHDTALPGFLVSPVEIVRVRRLLFLRQPRRVLRERHRRRGLPAVCGRGLRWQRNP